MDDERAIQRRSCVGGAKTQGVAWSRAGLHAGRVTALSYRTDCAYKSNTMG
jgi:hypothetical protein